MIAMDDAGNSLTGATNTLDVDNAGPTITGLANPTIVTDNPSIGVVNIGDIIRIPSVNLVISSGDGETVTVDLGAATGTGLVAGFGPTGSGYRPGFSWYFGGDTSINSFGLVAAGQGWGLNVQPAECAVFTLGDQLHALLMAAASDENNNSRYRTE